MKPFICLITLLWVASCTRQNNSSHSSETQTAFENNGWLVPATKRKSGHPDADTLEARCGNHIYLLSPNGKLIWGHGNEMTIVLSKNNTIESAFLYEQSDTLYLFYTETDQESATSRFEKIELRNKKSLLTAEIPAFNLGPICIKENHAYITAIGYASRLNMLSGNFTYEYNHLYEENKGRFNSFDTIVFNGSQTLYISNNRKNNQPDSLVVDENLGADDVRYPQMQFDKIWHQADTLKKYYSKHDAFSERQFFCAFPNSYEGMNKLFGYDDDKGPAVLYTYPDGEKVLANFSKLKTIPRDVFFKKYFTICVNGIWDADHMREAFGLAECIYKEPEAACRVIAMAPDKDIISVFRFMFDGPHPDNETNEQEFQQLTFLFKKHNQRLSKLLKIAYAEVLQDMDCHGH